MAKKPKPEGKKYSYMDTYGDLVTLLMCFFVLLFAMSTIQEEKFNAFAQGLASQFAGPVVTRGGGGSPPDAASASTPMPDASAPPQGDVVSPEQQLPQDFSQLGQAIQEYVEEHNMQEAVKVEIGESGAVFIRMQNNLLFEGDSYVLLPVAQDFLIFLGETLLTVQDQIYRVNFIGHTATVAGSAVDDWRLSCNRSGSVASFFQSNVGFSAGKMETTGFGKNYPIADNQTSEGRSMNRRVDIVVVGNEADNLAAALTEASRVYFPGDTNEFYEGNPADLPDAALDSLQALITPAEDISDVLGEGAPEDGEADSSGAGEDIQVEDAAA